MISDWLSAISYQPSANYLQADRKQKNKIQRLENKKILYRM